VRVAVDGVIEGVEQLIEALDGRDAFTIELANAALTRALDDLRAIGAWRDSPEDLARIDHAISLAEAARVRINLLTDMTQRKMEMLDSVRSGEAAAPTYGREGRSRQAQG